MGLKERILKPIGKSAAGIHLPHLKDSAEVQTVIMPPPKEVRIPLSQHIGAPAKPLVKRDDEVFVGTSIAAAGGFVSAPVHSSVSGKVTNVTDTHIIISCDGKQTVAEDLAPFPIKTAKDIAAAADACGLVGLGGAGFPSKVKLTLKEDTVIDTLVINATECEPYITSDCRECLENYEDVVAGAYLLKEILNIPNVIICVESNKAQAIEKLYEIATDARDVNDTVKLMKVPTRYPQGAEKVVIYSATGRKVPLGKLPSDVGCIVMNITTVSTLYRFIKTGMPLVSKRVTVDGTAVSEPKNVIVPLGTPIKDLLEFVGGIDEDANEIMMGGPMMGIDVCSEDAVVEKRNNAITVMKQPLKPQKQTACINCGRCAAACSMKLYPSRVEAAVNHKKYDSLEKLNVNYCMECGSCSYVCPAKRPLTQVMRVAKTIIRRESSK